ncbi:translation initiation factor IF-2, partial [Candidatus Pacearchaeota archaeon]|nr:translation initiation factor IF-2 [Candidatus Pacearchaeota archaeon]MBD3283049.1 translation initiation factor IF-2 [Candidatus Pacearchaeota archaeon]
NPIITVAGHVDHGKTTILDSIRKTKVYDTEAGGITQKISFTKVPIEEIIKTCPRVEGIKEKLDFNGFLFIDTPGHAAFSHLRKRGGALADLAILILDINEGIMPQTQEVIELLKINKIPFVVALNKIDNISGWRKQSEDLKQNIEMQAENIKIQFNEKLFTIIGALHNHGFNAKIFYEVRDFTTELALVPCSGKTGEGIQELTMMLCGLSQRFLTTGLNLGKQARGVILEIKKQKDMQYAEAILYDGELKQSDEIAIASFDEPIISKIRVLEEILPVSNRFKPVVKTKAANGIRMQLVKSEGILSGMPFIIYEDNLEDIKREFEKEVGEKIHTDEKGIIVKADSLGSLEALITMLREERIPIISAGIGKINKKDVISAQTNSKNDPENSIILGFNTEEDDEIENIDSIKIIKNDVIYRLIEDLLKYQEEKRNEIKREKLMKLAAVSKIKILHQFVFRNSNPAIFGVAVEAGKLKPGTSMMNEQGKKIGKVKNIQDKNQSINEAGTGMEIAISIPGINFERQLMDSDYLYSDISEGQFKQFKDNKEILTQDEIQTLQKIAQIKRKEKPTWGV